MTSITGTEPSPRSSAPTLEHVALATDDSSGTLAAAEWLADRAARIPIAVEILVAEGRVRAGTRTGPAHEIGEGVAWGMREYLRDRVPSAPTTIRVLAEDLEAAIRGAALGNDLLVIGCNRARRGRRAPIATRSTRIAEQAVVPTVVVPAGWAPRPGPVVVAVAGTAHETVDWAAAEAASAGRELVLVHSDAAAWALAAVPFPLPDVDVLAEAERRMLATQTERARLAHPGLAARAVTEHEGIVPLLQGLGATAALVVVGAHARGHRGAGSIARRVLEQAVGPVVLIPGREAT